MIDGNSETHELQIPFEVIDCRAPSPICINGLALSLQPLPPFTDADGDGDDDPGAMTVFATDLIASPTTDCTPPVRYSINRVGEPASVESPSLVVTCDDPETLLVEVHAWDETPASAGGPLHDYCETYILVQDPQQLCPE